MKKLLAITCLSVLLSACGFHLRGAVPLAPALQRVYLQSTDPYSQLSHNLEQSLKLSGVEIVATPMEASVILNIVNESEGQQMLSVGGTQQTRQYNLILTVNFLVIDPQGVVLIPVQTVTETAAITIQSNQVLAGSNEATNIYQQMRRAIVFDIMYRLSSKSTTEKLNQHIQHATTNATPATSEQYH